MGNQSSLHVGAETVEMDRATFHAENTLSEDNLRSGRDNRRGMESSRDTNTTTTSSTTGRSITDTRRTSTATAVVTSNTPNIPIKEEMSATSTNKLMLDSIHPETRTTRTMIRSSSASSECYRLPLFRRKSDPLAVVVRSTTRSNHISTSYANETATAADGTTCFPKSTVSSSRPSFTSPPSVLSFQSCKDGTLSDDDDENINNNNNIDDDGGDQDHRDAANHRTPSSILGCVASPLQLPKSTSWSNLMGLDDALEQHSYGYTEEERTMEDGDGPTPSSDLHGPKDYWIVTTAALPWTTGTAINPLLRAAYLSQRNRQLLAAAEGDHDNNIDTPPTTRSTTTTTTATITRPTVTLVLPWLDVPDDRVALYGPDWQVANPERQEAYIRHWLAEAAQLPLEASLATNGIHIQWYPARYHKSLSSIFAMGDLCELIPENTNNMICILEEPEHVNCYRAPGRESWRDKFPHVVGIVHTNYKAYAQNHYSGLLTGPIVGALMGLMVRAYCDKVVKLSPVLQSYAPYKEVVCNVHGIRHEFFTVPQRSNSLKHIYFIGKLLWAKGLDKLMDLEACYRKATGSYFGIDIYGSGPQEADIQKSFLGQDFGFSKGGPPSSLSLADEKKEEESTLDNVAQRYWRRFRQPIPARFLGRRDHAEVGHSGNYQIFVNPSITEVLCTTTAEAIAMGMWVIVPKHASNEFFLTFDNCLQYSNRREFVEILKYCQTNDPPGWCSGGDDRSADNRFVSLSWEAATDRFIATASLSVRDAKRSQRLQPRDRSIQDWHYALGRGTGGDVLRKVLGGGPVADQSQYSSSARTSSPSSSSHSPTQVVRTESTDTENLDGSDSERATQMIQAMLEAIGDRVEACSIDEDSDGDDYATSLLSPLSLEHVMC